MYTAQASSQLDRARLAGPAKLNTNCQFASNTCWRGVQVTELEASLRIHERSPAEEGEFHAPLPSSSAAPPPPPLPLAEAECPTQLDRPQGQPGAQQGVLEGAVPPPPPLFQPHSGGAMPPHLSRR